MLFKPSFLRQEKLSDLGKLLRYTFLLTRAKLFGGLQPPVREMLRCILKGGRAVTVTNEKCSWVRPRMRDREVHYLPLSSAHYRPAQLHFPLEIFFQTIPSQQQSMCHLELTRADVLISFSSCLCLLYRCFDCTWLNIQGYLTSKSKLQFSPALIFACQLDIEPSVQLTVVARAHSWHRNYADESRKLLQWTLTLVTNGEISTKELATAHDGERLNIQLPVAMTPFPRKDRGKRKTVHIVLYYFTLTYSLIFVSCTCLSIVLSHWLQTITFFIFQYTFPVFYRALSQPSLSFLFLLFVQLFSFCQPLVVTPFPSFPLILFSQASFLILCHNVSYFRTKV